MQLIYEKNTNNNNIQLLSRSEEWEVFGRVLTKVSERRLRSRSALRLAIIPTLAVQVTLKLPLVWSNPASYFLFLSIFIVIPYISGIVLPYISGIYAADTLANGLNWVDYHKRTLVIFAAILVLPSLTACWKWLIKV